MRRLTVFLGASSAAPAPRLRPRRSAFVVRRLGRRRLGRARLARRLGSGVRGIGSLGRLGLGRRWACDFGGRGLCPGRRRLGRARLARRLAQRPPARRSPLRRSHSRWLRSPAVARVVTATSSNPVLITGASNEGVNASLDGAVPLPAGCLRAISARSICSSSGGTSDHGSLDERASLGIGRSSTRGARFVGRPGCGRAPRFAVAAAIGSVATTAAAAAATATTTVRRLRRSTAAVALTIESGLVCRPTTWRANAATTLTLATLATLGQAGTRAPPARRDPPRPRRRVTSSSASSASAEAGTPSWLSQTDPKV